MSATFVLSDLTADFDQFVNQFQTALVTKSAWQGNLTTQTSTTLTEMISAVGTLHQGRIIRASEDAFSETAQSDDAILAIAQMQGLRLSRYLPAGSTVMLTSPVQDSIGALTQFTCGGRNFFNREAITLAPNVGQLVTLYEGTVNAHVVNGLGTDRQFYILPEDKFVISDQDVIVTQNGTVIPKSFGNLWNFDGLPGYADMTTYDGRLMVLFGSTGGVKGQFGTIPGVNDTMAIIYVVTSGSDANGMQLMGKSVTANAYPALQGVMQENPSGGASTKDIVAYKNVAAGSFGTYSSAVTKNQYQALIATYPGIVDAVTQAQREIDPADLRWMNVVRVSALTTSPWTPQQKKDFTNYCQKQTMYAVYFLWQDAIAVPRKVDVDVYIYSAADPSTVEQNSVTAVTKLFAPRPGILMTNFYEYDIQEVITNANPGLVSYVKVNKPTDDMIVTAPPSPALTYALVQGQGGTLGESVYSYSVSTVAQYTDGDGNVRTEYGFPDNWVFPQVVSPVANYAIDLNWTPVENAIKYRVWGRRVTSDGSQLGLLAELDATNLTFRDHGTEPILSPLPTSKDFPIKYNSLESLNINVKYSSRQQRQIGEDPTRLLGG